MPKRTDESQGQLFGPPKRGKSLAPESLPEREMVALREWAERTVPWISRGAFESFTTLEQHVEEVLEWWAGAGRMRSDWRRTIQNRVRKVERDRLERMARAGNQDARLALRAPEEWARRYDRSMRETAVLSSPVDSDGGLIRPRGGKVVSLRKPGT